MAKKKTTGKPGRPKSENPRGEGIQVRIAPDVVRMAREISPPKGVSVTDYLSAILRPVVTRDYAQLLRTLKLEQEGDRS